MGACNVTDDLNMSPSRSGGDENRLGGNDGGGDRVKMSSDGDGVQISSDGDASPSISLAGGSIVLASSAANNDCGVGDPR
jgi:hypothetical protein